MTTFTVLWYAVVLVWVIFGAGFGTLNYWWLFIVPVPYWIGRRLFASTGVRSWNFIATICAALMVVVLLLVVADTVASSLPPHALE